MWGPKAIECGKVAPAGRLFCRIAPESDTMRGDSWIRQVVCATKIDTKENMFAVFIGVTGYLYEFRTVFVGV
jgi:hypothetical protein